MNQRFRSLSTGILVAVISLALTLSAVEVLLRLGIMPQTVFRPTAINEAHESEAGSPDFRLSVPDLSDKDEAFRILVIGDSFAWGDGVYAQDAFPHRLETRLNVVSRGDRFEVVNWSRPGWNTRRQVRSLKKGKKLAWLQPDLMILSFVLNDPEPVSLQDREGLLAGTTGHEAARGLSYWLVDHSRLYELVWTRLENNRTHQVLRAYYRSLYEGEHWEDCVKAITELERMSQNHGVPMILVIWPVFDGPMDDTYPYRDLHAQVARTGQQLGVPVLDLLGTYRGVDGSRLPVRPFSDAHPNELAHRMGADGILDYLVQSKLVPKTDYQPARRRQNGQVVSKR